MNYKTQDIWTASALMAKGFECKAETVGYLLNGKQKYNYVFEETPELKEAVYKIGNKEMPVDVETLKENYITLKNFIHKDNL